jgi:hypothetical protein
LEKDAERTRECGGRGALHEEAHGVALMNVERSQGSRGDRDVYVLEVLGVEYRQLHLILNQLGQYLHLTALPVYEHDILRL